MSQPDARQAARQTVRDAQRHQREGRIARDGRLRRLAETVLVALADRDVAVAACEQRAGKALAAMTREEGLSLTEAVQWCGAAIASREASRLRRLADADGTPAAAQKDGA